MHTSLSRELGIFQYLTIGVGAIVGIAWIMVLGEWIGSAGPLGAVLAFVVGGALMALIAACYSELSASMPFAGGEVVYARALFGERTSFVVGWFLVLTATSITSFEAVSFARLMTVVFPDLRGPVLYHVLGAPLSLDSLVLGLASMAVITAVNYRGVRSSSRLQDGFTFIKLAAALVFIAAGMLGGNVSNLQPLVQHTGERPAWLAATWIAATAPFWFGGFQIICQAIEERRTTTSVRAIGWAAICSVLIGIVFYCLIVTSSAMAAPRSVLVSADLPAASAMHSVLGNGWITKLILLGVILGILATWNACVLWATRLLVAQARAGFVPAFLGETRQESGAPVNAVLLVAAIGTIGMFFGSSLIVPIVNTGAISLAFVYTICCAGLLRHRRRTSSSTAAFRVAGGTPVVILAAGAALIMALFCAFEPATRSDGRVPAEWWLVGGWSALGMACWRYRSRLRLK